jgi:5,10-methylenetetrahydromethanopterin reductase
MPNMLNKSRFNRRLRFGSAVLPIWTRNPAVIAATWGTLWELAGKVAGKGCVMLGIGAWWEPIAARVGVNRVKPLKAMRKHIEALRQRSRNTLTRVSPGPSCIR